MIKNKVSKTILLLTASYVVVFITPASAGTPTARALQMHSGITVRQLAPIAFGTFAGSGSGGTITIDAGSGARILSGTVSALSSGDYGQAEFLISGRPGAQVVLMPPASSVLSNGGAGGNMIITDFKISPSEIIMLNHQGIAKIKIGGLLKVPAHIPPGPYNGFFNVTAHYTR